MYPLLSPLVVLFLLFFVTGSTDAIVVDGPSITVRPVQKPEDVIALADLRYDEWIEGVFDDTSRASFRAASQEIVQQRTEGGATAFLAFLKVKDDAVVVAGAAELSPIEIEGAVRNNRFLAMTMKKRMLYVTDVVTASTYRRQGIARALMKAIEDAAVAKAGTHLLLHVEPSNTAALNFYIKIGYTKELPDYCTATLDMDRLAENACTEGQILLSKSIQKHAQTRLGIFVPGWYR